MSLAHVMRAALLTASLALSVAVGAPRVALAADPTVPECLTASNTSVKLRTSHKLAEARSQLLICTAASCPAEVRTECSLRMDQLNAMIPTVVFDAKDGAGHDLTTVKVTMDGQVVATQLDGTAVTCDPGSHVFTFEADGQTVADTVVIKEGEKSRHVAVVLGQPAPQVAPVAPAAPVARGPLAPVVDTSNSRRTIAFGVGGAGVAGLVVGGIFGGLTLASWSSANGACPSHDNCSATATSQRQSAVTDSTVSDVALIVGGVLVATGVTLYLTAPKGHVPGAGLSVGPGRLSLEGSF